MTDVFLSYCRADRAVAEAIAQELRQLGVDVWWDNHDILSGEDYRRRISDTLERIRAAIVIWSRQSIESQWVISEAATARDRKVLVPVSIDGKNPQLIFVRSTRPNSSLGYPATGCRTTCSNRSLIGSIAISAITRPHHDRVRLRDWLGARRRVGISISRVCCSTLLAKDLLAFS